MDSLTRKGDHKRKKDVEYNNLKDGEHVKRPLHVKRPKTWPEPQPYMSADPMAYGLTTSGLSVVSAEPSAVTAPVVRCVPSSVLFQEVCAGSESPTLARPEPRSTVATLTDHFYNLERSPSHTPTSSRRGAHLQRKALIKEKIGASVKMASEDEEDDIDDDYGFSAPRQIPLDGTYQEEEASQRDAPPSSPEPAEKDETYGPRDKFNFDWQPFPSKPVPPVLRREQFNELSGPTRSFSSSYDAFTAIWDADVMQIIVSETNKYAISLVEERLEKGDLGPRSRISDWQDTTADELYVYFGLVMAMGVCYKQQIKEYWISTDGVTDTPNFRKYMTYGRYLLLNRCLHFRDNADINAQLVRSRHTVSQVKVEKIKPIINHLNTKFQDLYNLGHNIVIDESLVKWKGWLQITQYIKDKAASVGIRTFELCDSKNGYLWRLELYTGSDGAAVVQNPLPLEGEVTKLVISILKGLEYSHRTVWMDNYYNSPSLARHLKSIGLDCVGTLRTNQQFVPDELRYSDNLQNISPGEIAGTTSGDVDLLVWRNKNLVPMISTYHGIVTTTENKPVVVLDYNICMREVDRKDKLLSQYPIERKRTKIWYKKIFRRLLNASITNSYILLKESEGAVKMDHGIFRKNLIKSLLHKHAPLGPITEPLRSVSRTLKQSLISVPIFGKTIKSHFPDQYPIYPGKKGERQRKTCLVCQRRTPTFCPECKVPLCVFALPEKNVCCFLKHHS